MGAIIGIGLNLLLLAGVVLAIRAVVRHRGTGTATSSAEGLTVRRFFQYIVLFGLVTIVAIGVAGLLGRAIGGATSMLVSDQASLARNVTFVVVGVPLLILMTQWTRRLFMRDPSEGASLAWTFYISAMTLTSLVTTMVASHDVLSWALTDAPFRGTSVAQAVVWFGVWLLHWRLGHTLTPATNLRLHLVAGSVIGLAVSVVGLMDLVSSAFDLLVPEDTKSTLVVSQVSALSGLVTFLVGAPVWWIYWIRNLARSTRDTLWLAYVLLAGLAAPLILTIAAASTAVYDALVWWLGDPIRSDAASHFGDTPEQIAAVVVGLVAWWYHRSVLTMDEPAVRTEVRRVYEYLMSGIALVASAIGLATVLVALTEALTTSPSLLARSATNTLLAALTLLAVGVPVWWIYWRAIQQARRTDPETESTAPTRRTYLFILFGVGGIAAVVALLVAVFFLLEDILEGNLALGTIRRMRVPVGILITTAIVAGYHWLIYREDRDYITSSQRGPRFALLIGPADEHVIDLVRRSTGGRAVLWSRDDGATPWDAPAVVAALQASEASDVIVLAEPEGPRVIAVNPRGS